MQNSDIRGGVVIVPDVGQSAGAVIWWRLAGGVSIAALAEAWAAAGLDPSWLPAVPSCETVLHRAVLALGARRRLVRPLSGAKGWAIVAEIAQGEDLTYEVQARVRANGAGIEIDPIDGPVADAIRVEYRAHDGILDANDVGTHLVRNLGRCDAIALRVHGGVYFVPAHGIEIWRRVAAVTAGVTRSAIYEVPAIKTDEAVAAILAAVAAEAEAVASEVETDLSDETGIGLRAIRTRQARVDRLVEKLARYESLCGRGVAEIVPRIETIRAGLAAAALAAQAQAVV